MSLSASEDRETRYYVDDHSFQFDGFSTERISELLGTFYSVLVALTSTPGQAVITSGILSRRALLDLTLADVLFQVADRDIGLLVGIALDRLDTWDVDCDELPDLEISCPETSNIPSPALAACVSQLTNGEYSCCISTDIYGFSIAKVRTSDGFETNVEFVSRPEDIKHFWRNALIQDEANSATFAKISYAAYPNTEFADNIWQSTRRLEGGLTGCRQALVEALAGLDDHAAMVWEKFAAVHEIQQHLKSVAGVVCSPESPKTHRNSAAMKQRLAKFGDAELLCEWHAKLEAHRNRVHFTIKNGQLYVGIFSAHLTT